ncbi:MAG: hypothetical protein K9J16_08025 [Melioribacteraceae bacterium]|nr:hypothetical protein [Melioribacteraceae bacterium]MCF8353849.1 hypothetical protein [Melioribacteraceae bacterium]MCF8393082.1 hypothetical protein [Melioribacteraceae bacterium]MCF8419201.1 hypothetical protein [Melioribacteraceae bacterium]
MKNIALVLAISVGVLLPYGHAYSYLLKYMLMGLLLFAFLDIELNKNIIRREHLYILLVNLITPVLLFYVIHPFNETLALAAFITSLAPSALASPVVVSLLKRKVEFAVVSVLLTNAIVTLLIPFLFPLMLGRQLNISFADVVTPVFTVFFVPFAAAYLLKSFLPSIHSFLLKHRDQSFYFLVMGIYLGTSKASNYLFNEHDSSFIIVFIIAASSLILCSFNFITGNLIGGKELNVEAGQSLGQKNNGFTIWLSVTFINPIAVIGPVFYILFQNLYVTWQLYRLKKNR